MCKVCICDGSLAQVVSPLLSYFSADRWEVTTPFFEEWIGGDSDLATGFIV
jgi:hypothetical protein